MKRKLFAMLAAAAAALTPLAASSQVSSPPGSATAEPSERVFKYQASAGYSYTSLNQLNQSRSGLQGVELSVTRDFGKHFGVIADGAYYKYAIKTGNPGNPSVDAVLFGPVFHADLYGRLSGLARVLLGGEHTAGNGTIPNVSFAGGFGIGMEYSLSPRLALRAVGDDIYSSFVQDPKHLGYSPHERSNGRGSLSVVFKF